MATEGEIKWIKLSTGIFDNDKIKQIEVLPEGDSLIVIWLKLLVLAGEKNDGGAIYFTKSIPYTEQMLAVAFRRPLSTVQLALRTFESFGMIEIVNDFICLPNWEKYQSVEGMERVRQKTRERVQRYREREAEKKALPEPEEPCSVTVALRNADVTVQNKKENKKEEKEEVIVTSDDVTCRAEARRSVMTAWNELGISNVTKLTTGSLREKMLNARLNEYGLDGVLNAIRKIRQSAFLRGQNRNGWVVTFDWFLKPNNFCKVIDGNYDEHAANRPDYGRNESTVDRLARLAREGAFDE